MINLKGIKRSWPNFNILSRHLPAGLRKITKNLNQVSQHLNLGPPGYEAGVLSGYLIFTIGEKGGVSETYFKHLKDKCM
jgi:hypothetical protein